MLAPPPPPLKPRPNGAWFGLGWDVVHQTPHGPSYAKDGGIAGVRSYIGHMPGNIDWAVVFNGGRNVPGQPGRDANAAKHLQEGIRQTQRWPETDYFPDFPDVRPARAESRGILISSGEPRLPVIQDSLIREPAGERGCRLPVFSLAPHRCPIKTGS